MTFLKFWAFQRVDLNSCGPPKSFVSKQQIWLLRKGLGISVEFRDANEYSFGDPKQCFRVSQHFGPIATLLNLLAPTPDTTGPQSF